MQKRRILRRKIYLEVLAERFSEICNTTIKTKADYRATLETLSGTLQKLTAQNKVEKIVYSLFHWFIDSYYDNCANLYRMGKDFYQDLMKVNMDIDVKYLDHTDNEIMCFELPEPFIEDGMMFYSVIVAFTRDSKQEKTMSMMFCGVNENNKPTDHNKVIVLGCESGTVEDGVKVIPEYQESDVRLSWVKALAKCVLYIKSGEPDLVKEVFDFESKKPKNFQKKVKKQSPFTIVNVGYNYHKQHFHTASTQVRTHPRWQPYGPQRSRIKLIWVKEHTRTYKSEKIL